MTQRLGDGIPSTITPERIRGILKFAKSQEKEFRETLDQDNSPAWRRTTSTHDLYRRLHDMIQTVDGRQVYERVRVIFEKAKRKRSGRADLLKLLWKDVSGIALGANDPVPFGKDGLLLYVSEKITLHESWDRVAELLWSHCALHERDKGIPSGNFIVEVLNRNSELGPYLAEVQDGLLIGDTYPTQKMANGERNASTLINDITVIVTSLDPEYLDRDALDRLHRLVQNLCVIAETAEQERHTIENLRLLISEWRDSHHDKIDKSAKISAYISKLSTLVEARKIDQLRVDGILSLFGDAFNAEDAYDQTLSESQQAIASEDFESAKQLVDAAESRKKTRDKLYGVVDTEMSRASQGDQQRTTQQEAALPHTLDNIKNNTTPPDNHNLTEPAPPLEQDAGSVQDFSIPAPDVRVTSGGDAADIGARGTHPKLEESKPRSADGVTIPRIEAGIVTAIERRRFAIAYHLARAVPTALPGANAIKLIVSNYATDDPAANELPRLADALLSEMHDIFADNKLEQHRLRDYIALLTCAALRPALALPGSSVGQLLSFSESRMGNDMPSLRALARATADYSMLGFHFTAELLRGDGREEKWKEKEISTRRDMRSWVENNRRVRFKYQRATVVWKQILDVWQRSERYSLGWILKELGEPANEIDIAAVSKRIDHWRDNGIREIDRIDREKHRGREKIIGSARIDLRNKISEAVDLAYRRCRLASSQPAGQNKFQEKQANALRNLVRSLKKPMFQEISRLTAPMAHVVNELISSYLSMFEISEPDGTLLQMRLPDLLNGWMLSDPDVRIDEFSGTSELDIDVQRLINLIDSHDPDFGRAAIVRARRGDFRAADATISFALAAGLIDNDGADHVKEAIEQERELALGRIRQTTGKVGQRLDDSYARGIISLATFNSLRHGIPMDESLDVDEIKSLDGALKRIDNGIKEAEARAGGRLRQALDALDNVAPDEQERIQNAIEGRQHSVAEDYIERIRGGKALPTAEASTPRTSDNFFLKFVGSYNSFRNSSADTWNQVRDAIENRTQTGPIDATSLSKDESREGRHLLKEWSDLHAGESRTAKVERDNLQALLRLVGFIDASVHLGTSSGNEGVRVFSLVAKPISDRDICQLADFGSRAEGRYRLIVIEGYTTAEKIIQEVSEGASDGGLCNIVLFLNPLDSEARHALALGLFSERSRPTLVLDEALAVFLATQPKHRLAAFFHCATPLTVAQPFDPDATEVPPEMFFGRDSERRAILAMSGTDEITHFIYGGRRLGKTALLANIVRMCEIDNPNWVVSLINLKGTGIGTIREVHELWKEIAVPLAERKIVTLETIRPRSIADRVLKWLGQHPDYRILLLVDEADDFLEADGRGRYQILEEIKHLMDRTQRRFKVVFAGLHNVQRTARDPNTPFAHLGKPIRIGPMLPETDPEEIENLICRPLEALGYRFASIDSVIRIAAETNYYPALAQQFCKELLSDLRENRPARGSMGPPYTIMPEVVEGVLVSRETRERIRNLFLWTIQLDPRYEFLTYLVARHTFGKRGFGFPSVPIDDIRQMALKEWPAGFESDDTFLTFQVLLEEMVGLGILRRVGDGENYVIRTRNLRVLLGNDDEIERCLKDATRKPPPARFDSASFRITLDDGAPSPLAASQESQILSGRKVVALVFGTSLGGLDRIGEALSKAGENKSPNITVHKSMLADMDEVLQRVSRGRAAGIHIVLIDGRRGKWGPEFVKRAAEFLARLDFRERTIRPVFLLGSGEAWARLDDTTWQSGKGLSMDGLDVKIQEIWLAPCARDFTRMWLRDRDAPACAELEKDQSIDSLWPIVAQAATGERSKSVADAIGSVLASDDFISDIFTGSTVRTALKVLSAFPDDSMTADDLCDFARDEGAAISPETADRIFDWGSRLGILHSDERGYRLDSTYAAALRRASGE